MEVLSPSNTSAKVNRQRIIALSAGTQEFWVVDPGARTVHVTSLGGAAGQAVSSTVLGGTVEVDQIFAAL
ncbi:MAG: Uma2 family endonuclease [Bryobacteraceae bacterium]|nr:Uma2 family endonuclease [Bryobacteraceae bacterium]